MAGIMVPCNACGAKLHVPPHVRYVSCDRCGASLAVRQEGGAWFTESPQGPIGAGGSTLDNRDVERMNDRLEELSVQNELLRLDQEWQMEQERHMMTSKYGARYRPNAAGAVVMGVVAVVGGLIWMVFTGSMIANSPSGMGGPPTFLPLFGLLFIAFGVGAAIWQFSKAQAYKEAEETYKRRRRALLDRLGNPFRRDTPDEY
jgi:hypothetical protein